jgi:hypothetical protein
VVGKKLRAKEVVAGFAMDVGMIRYRGGKLQARNWRILAPSF